MSAENREPTLILAPCQSQEYKPDFDVLIEASTTNIRFVHSSVSRAREACGKCSIVQRCLEYGFEGDKTHPGVWGGRHRQELEAFRTSSNTRYQRNLTPKELAALMVEGSPVSRPTAIDHTPPPITIPMEIQATMDAREGPAGQPEPDPTFFMPAIHDTEILFDRGQYD